MKYLLAPLLAMVMVFVMGALKSIRQQLGMKRIIGSVEKRWGNFLN